EQRNTLGATLPPARARSFTERGTIDGYNSQTSSERQMARPGLSRPAFGDAEAPVQEPHARHAEGGREGSAEVGDEEGHPRADHDGQAHARGVPDRMAGAERARRGGGPERQEEADRPPHARRLPPAVDRVDAEAEAHGPAARGPRPARQGHVRD